MYMQQSSTTDQINSPWSHVKKSTKQNKGSKSLCDSAGPAQNTRSKKERKIRKEI